MVKSDQGLYSLAQIRNCEEQAFQHGIDEDELMLRAGSQAFFFVKRLYPQVYHIAIYCGSGNNAGDGYVFARLAHEAGLAVAVYQCKQPEELPLAAKKAALAALAAGVPFHLADEALDTDVELIIDALLGIGLKGPVHGLIANLIQLINASGLPVVSLDLPSGLNAYTGAVESFCIKAKETLTFIAQKTGLYTLDGPDYCGEIYCLELKIQDFLAQLTPRAILLNKNNVATVASRKKNSHKGLYGNVLVIGGGPGMPGAVGLAARAALRTGAGSVTIATWPEHVGGLIALIPEAMIWGIKTVEELQPLLNKATVCVIGPGLGDCEWARSLFLSSLTSQVPVVIDASALRLLSEQGQIDDNWILTPHPGEAASLLGCSTKQIETDRYQSIALLQQRYGGIIVLKGVGTLVQAEDKQTFLCPKGNPGMASAGMGDVLTGIIAGLCAQHLPLSEAAKLGVWLHACAGDALASSLGKVGILASDLIEILPDILNKNDRFR